jgi:hypothetical protein
LTKANLHYILNLMQPTAVSSLPEKYLEIASIDLSKDRKLLLILNIIGIILFFLFGWFFLHLAKIRNPSIQDMSIPINIWLIIIFFIASIITFLLHEIVHGIFFWFFTRSIPRFGFKGAYAFAAAPGWYIRRNPYFVIGLSPIIIISLVGLLLLPAAPAFLVTPLLIILTVNASGAVGDLAVCIWLTRFPPQTLILDHGDAIILFNLKED